MKNSSVTLVAMLALATLAPAPRSFAGDKIYRDARYKFSLKYSGDWEQMPVEAGQKDIVCKFYDPSIRNQGFAFDVGVEVARIEHTGGAPVTGKQPDKPTELTEEALRALYEDQYKPKDAFELFSRTLRTAPDFKWPDPKKDGKAVKSADGIEGRMISFETCLVDAQNKAQAKEYSYFAAIASFAKDGVEYGICATAPAMKRSDYDTYFKGCFKSFRFFDEHAKDVKGLSVLDGINISPKRRLEIESTLVKGWDVIVSPKKNYIIIYDTNGLKNGPLARELAKRIERIREQVYEVQFPPAQPITAVSIVRICRDREQYFAYGGPGSTAGYWNSGSEELVFFDASPSKKVDYNTLAVLYHEAFHQYIYYSVGSVAPHSWFNEGHGDYYAGANFNGAKVKIDPFKWRIGTVKQAIVEGPRACTVTKDPKTGKETKTWDDKKGYTPLKDLVAFTQGDYYSYPFVSYAQGWSLIYFLREVVPKNKAYNAKWGKILPTYFDTLKAEVNKGGKLKRGGLVDPPDPPQPKDPGPADPDKPKPSGGDEPKPEPPGAPDAPKPPEPNPPNPQDPGGTEPEPPEVDPGLQPEVQGIADESALETALRVAFEGVDMDELEKAWIKATKQIGG